jgi:nitrite reductase/ring-hydroxylating ferredoxin subunit
VCRVEDLPEGERVIVDTGVKLGIGVYNIHGKYVAVRNVCPHAGAPLCLGMLGGAPVSDTPNERTWAYDGEILKCPWHGWEFKLPEGVTLTDPPIKVKTFPVVIEDGMVVVDLTPTRPSPSARAAAR